MATELAQQRAAAGIKHLQQSGLSLSIAMLLGVYGPSRVPCPARLHDAFFPASS